MCVFDFLFSLPVLVAVAWRVCMIKRTKQKKKMLGKTLLTQTQTTKERERIVSRGWCLRFSLCAFAVLLWVCVCCLCCYRPSAFVVDFVSSRGMDWFVCVFLFCFCLKRALFLSLSFGSLTLSLSLAIVLPSYLHWSPPQFDYFYQKVLSFFIMCFCFL